MKLKNRIVIITGASSGIGKAIALLFAEEGATVVLASRRKGLLEKAKKEVEKNKGKAEVIKTDMSKEKEIKNLIDKTIKRFKKIDILVNNAGIYIKNTIDKLSVQDFDRTMDINLRGLWIACKYASKYMKKRKNGLIINISSKLGKEAHAKSSVYSASKFGVIGITKALEDDLKKYNIKVTTINPAYVNTPLIAGRTYLKGKYHLLLQPEDIAELALFIATRPLRVEIPEVDINSFLWYKTK